MYVPNKEVIRVLDKFFKSNNINYALIGGLAITSYRNIRNTNDLDFVVSVSPYEVDKLYDLILKQLNIEYCELHHSIITINIKFISVDIIPAETIFEEKLLKDAKYRNIFATKCRVGKLEDLLLLKLSISGMEERHLRDVEGICKKCKDIIDYKYLKKSIIILHMEDKIPYLNSLLENKIK